MKILVTGKNGQLGKSIQKIVDGKNKQKFKSYDFVFIGRNELDFFNISDINYFFDNNYFDVVINCAAYTQVDQAESDEKKANLINHIAVKEIAKISKKNNMNLIHISTDFVFDGLNKRPYCENDKTLPLNVYGKTKLAGERAILSIMEFNAIILRTSWVYSRYGNNFVNTILDLCQKNGSLNIVSDQIGTPTSAYDLALSILSIISSDKFLKNNKLSEIFHYSNKGESNWYEFANEIIRISGIHCQLNPINTEEYPLPAKRPKYSILSKKKIVEEYDLNIVHWKDSLRFCLKNL